MITLWQRLFRPSRREPPEYIFILSAMRSGSSLLQHLVGQHANVLSAGETKIEYHSDKELTDLSQLLFSYNERPPEERSDWVFLEKCVHNRYFPQPFATAHRIRFIFLLRDPRPCISSLMKMKDWPYTESVDAAAWYYKERFHALVTFAAALPSANDSYFMEYEDFLARPDAHLRELTGFLAFDQPLQPNYPKQKWTARLSLGDVSENIKTQRIQTGVQREVLAMSDALQAELESVHQQTAKELRRLCGWKL